LEPVKFEECNFTLGAPAGMPACNPLEVYRHDDGYLSCWELSTDDLDEVKRTRRIYLNVAGFSHPAVWLSAGFSHPAVSLSPVGVNGRPEPAFEKPLGRWRLFWQRLIADLWSAGAR